MTARHNIVSLNNTHRATARDSGVNMKSGGSITRRMSAPAIELKDLFGKQFAKQLQIMFDHIDDALFDLAENAPSNQQQNIFFESMREVRFKRIEIEKDFLDTMKQDFVALFSEPHGAGSTGSSEGLSENVEALSLMDEDIVEEMVAIDTMVAKYDKQLVTSLAALDARLAELAQLDVSLLSTGHHLNPIAPKALCNNFSTACRILSVDIKARIVVFKLFEKDILSSLEAIYKQANEKLIRANILPDFRAFSSHNTRQNNSQGASVSGQPVNIAGHVQSGQANVEAQQVQELTHLLNFVPQYAPQVGMNLQAGVHGVASNPLSGAIQLLSTSNAPVIGNEVLLQLLNSMQQGINSQNLANATTDQASFVDKPEDVLLKLASSLSAAADNGDHSIGQRERDVIGLVSMLFQFVLEDRVVSGPMKAAVSRLQIPIIKVALKEPNFFCSPNHPARLLLNEMTQAAVGWVAGKDYHKDPLYQSICGAVERIINEYEEDPQIFFEVMADLKSLVDDDNKRAELRKKRLVDAESGRDESASARLYIKQLLDEKVKPGTPKFIHQMIEAIWSNILFLAYLQKGRESDEWAVALSTLDKLLWTVASERSKHDRSEILGSLPELLRSVRHGFESVNCDKSASSAFFGQLEAYHMAVMQRPDPLPIVTVVVDNDANNNVESTGASAATTESSGSGNDKHTPIAESLNKPVGLVSNTAGDSAPQQDAVASTSINSAEALAVGQWVELHEGEQKKRCRLVAILRNSGKRIFVNRTGAKSGEYSVKEIAALLESEEMTLLEDAQLFDKALSSIINGLRKQQKDVVNA